MSIKTNKVDSSDPDISVGKVNKVYDRLLKVFQDNKLNVKEILLVYGNLGYTLGASIEGYQGKGPTASKLSELYALKPTLGNALMISGLNTMYWIEDLQKKIEELETKENKIND